MTDERIEHEADQTEHSLGHRPLPSESRSSLVIDLGDIQGPQCERGQVAVDGTRGVGEHPAWCSPADCFVTDEGVRVHQQAPTRWEDDTAELRCESRLLDSADDEHVYVFADRLPEYPAASTVRSVHHQAPRSLSVTSLPRFRPGVAPRGIGRGSRQERVVVDVDDVRTIGPHQICPKRVGGTR